MKVKIELRSYPHSGLTGIPRLCVVTKKLDEIIVFSNLLRVYADKDVQPLIKFSLEDLAVELQTKTSTKIIRRD
jgi:hypothetical protein